VDYSEDAIEYLRRTADGIEAAAADVTAPSFTVGGPVDVVVLSHVIEHLEEPQAFLTSVRRLDFSYLVAEVPLDDLLVGRAGALFQKDRTQNPAGHVQFFTARTFRHLLTSCGLTVIDDRRYLPTLDRETIDFICRKNRSSKLTRLKLQAGRWLRMATGPVWSRLMSAHYAVLCRN
jgi:hypothetical protein